MKSKRAREAAEADEKPINGTAAEDVPAKKRKRNDDNDADAADVKKVKKDKKDKKDKKHKKDKDKKESRKEKKDKRKDLQDLPEEDAAEEETEQQNGDAPAKAEGVKDAEKEKKKAEKKEKKKEKKQKEKKAKEDAAAAAPSDGAATNGQATTENTEENPIDLEESTTKKRDRHIVFVGNLPYTATTATVSAHFASLQPIAVRCLTNKDDDTKCRGIAFVEFGKVWHQRTCLDKFHHSMFDDGKSPARKINVELTAGGGGNNKNRQNKIREKNEKLNENRNKRIEREKAAKTESAPSPMEDNIHPSRRGRVPGMA